MKKTDLAILLRLKFGRNHDEQTLAKTLDFARNVLDCLVAGLDIGGRDQDNPRRKTLHEAAALIPDADNGNDWTDFEG